MNPGRAASVSLLLYVSTAELVALARVAARRDGFHISHIRDEAARTLEAVRAPANNSLGS
jgi:hypothetical protein